ncbi:MAG: hypothetical protein CVV12_08780 [Gammaproteobacteria bacterium HGW-Gammaproteobacteria-2]|nr:MAG: hypothetical protein CVV12_08780 [Gammaproteobacteria bacterium HGW-Gammaproteobacteria-2]
MNATVASLARLYGPTAAELADCLLNIGDGLQAQLDALHAHPTIEGCEQVASNLDGARRHVLRLRERLLAERVSGDE